jgi:hypothetical protein
MDLDPAAVERVLQRASDLTAHHPAVTNTPVGTSSEALVAAAAEVGIPADAVRMSLAIERLGPPPTRTRFDGLVGAGWIVSERPVPADVDTTLGRLDDVLRKHHGMRRVRSRQDGGEWRPRDGSLAKAMRVVKQVSGDQGVGDADAIVAEAREADPHRTVLRVSLDRRSQRTGRATGSAVVTSVGAAGLAVGATLVSPFVLIATPAVVVGGWATLRRGVKQATRSARELDRMLDAVEQGRRDQLRGGS